MGKPSAELKYYTDPEYRKQKLEQASASLARKRQNPVSREGKVKSLVCKGETNGNP